MGEGQEGPKRIVGRDEMENLDHRPAEELWFIILVVVGFIAAIILGWLMLK